MAENIKKFNTPNDTFIQLRFNGDPAEFMNFLEMAGENFFDDGWGWEPLGSRPTIFVPVNGYPARAVISDYIAIATNRPKGKDRYSVNKMDIETFF